MKSSLFVYGTLMSPQVTETLLGRLPKRVPSVLLRGYIPHPVRNQVYPGLVANEEKTTMGTLYFDLTPREMARLDWFEDVQYRRIDVTVEYYNAESTLQQCGTHTYLYIDDPKRTLDASREWSFDDFEREKLEWYLQYTVRPCRHQLDEIEQQEDR